MQATRVAYHTYQRWDGLQDADAQKLVTMYTQLRQESAMTHAMPVAVRHLEAMIRLSEACASMHLRDHVNQTDIDMAIKVMLESFIQV